MKNKTKLTLVLVLLFSSVTVSAQIGLRQELFKDNSATLNYKSPDFDNLLKAEYRGDYNTASRFEEENNWDDTPIDKYYPRRGTRNFVNVYLGLSNFLEDGNLPKSSELYSLNPIASWYGGINFDNITRLFSVLYLDWGIGVNVQEFAFENTRTRIMQTPDAITFYEETDISGQKSKIKLWHLNVHMVPTFAFGRYDSFRVGFGMYAGYKLSSSVIYKYDDADGQRQKDKNRGNWNINQFRYGMRATVGWNFFDLFFNYDITELFEEEVSAPRLNPVTFGVIF